MSTLQTTTAPMAAVTVKVMTEMWESLNTSNRYVSQQFSDVKSYSTVHYHNFSMWTRTKSTARCHGCFCLLWPYLLWLWQWSL